MKIAYVHTRCERHDACSNAMRDEIGWLAGAGHEVRLFGLACDFDELPFTRVQREADVAFHPFFQECDLAVFHFDGHDPLFNLLPVLPLRVRRIVVFHDLASSARLAAAGQAQVDRSRTQVSNIGFAHHVVCDNEGRLAFLRGVGITTPASVLPPALRRELQAPATKPSFANGVLRLLFMGPLTPSTQPLDFLHALEHLLQREPGLHLQADILTHPAFSDAATLDAVDRGIRELDRVFFPWLGLRLATGTSGQARTALLRDADLFVVPGTGQEASRQALDALACGCKTVAGDGAALDEAVRVAALAVGCSAWREGGYGMAAEAARRGLHHVSGPVVRERFLDFIHQQSASRS